MSQLNSSIIKQLAQLSRLHTTESEEAELLSALKKILDHVEQLNEVDTEGVEPCCHVLENVENLLREDLPGPTLDQKDLLANAPSHAQQMITVPPAIPK